MRSQSPDLSVRFQFDLPCERRMFGIGRTGEHEVLPDEQPQFVATFIEPVTVIEPSTPDADHVHRTRAGRFKKRPEVLLGLSMRKKTSGNPVGTSTEDRLVVDVQRKASFFRIELELRRTQTSAKCS